MSPSVSVRLLSTQSDARLVSFAHAGHERAFEALVRRYRRPLLGYCRRLLLSEERAEDALQQAFLQAWLALQAGTEVDDVKPWLYRIVHNAALNVLRVSGYDYCQLKDSLCGADAPQADLDRRIAVREALAGLAALPEMQREALLRTAVEGRTHQQVARDLGLSENALRGLVYRARATLRTTVGAIVPAPLLTWALGSGGRGAPIVERLSELAAGGGSVGVAGILVKGGAVAVTASVLAGGITSVHTHRKPVSHNAAAHAAGHRRVRTATSPALALTAVRTPNIDPAADTRHANASRSRSSPAHHAAPGHRRGSPRPSTIPFTTKISLPSTPPPSGVRDGGIHHGRDGGGGRDNETRGPDSANGHDGSSNTNVTGGGSDGHGGGSAAANGSDGGSGSGDRGTHGGGSSSNDGSSPNGTSSASSSFSSGGGSSSSSSSSGSTGGGSGSGDSSAISGVGQDGSASKGGGGEAPSGAAQSGKSSGGRGD